LDALAAVARVPNVFLVVAGDGPLRETFCEVAERLLPNRHLRLSLPAGEMAELYSCVDAFLHMGREEAFGSVYVEALGAGLPVVAHDAATTRWIFQESPVCVASASLGACESGKKRAWLVDTNDSMAVSDALLKALGVGGEAPERRHAYAASRFSWEKVGRQYASFLEEIARS
jgi:glycosyltransferase involved in cell wall biosynthesis